MPNPTPYITPDILVSAPTGMAWSTIPTAKSTQAEQLAEQTNICWRATHVIDAICQQPLRATLDTEEIMGPDYRLTVQNNGMGRVVVSRWPVLSIVAASVTPSTTFPVNFQPIPLNQMRLETALDGLYNSSVPGAAGAGPSAIDIAPGYVSWNGGRNGFRLRVTYINGWPHAGFTASVASTASTAALDDCTGFTGAMVQIYDGAFTEAIQVASTSASVGPGVATFASPLQFDHELGVIISALPATIQWATILAAVAESLTRGGMSITAQALPGSQTGGGGINPQSIMEEVKRLVQPYRRII